MWIYNQPTRICFGLGCREKLSDLVGQVVNSRVLAEMVRVTRPGGQVALIDIITSERPEKADLHNALERTRDPSHTRALPLSELIMLFVWRDFVSVYKQTILGPLWYLIQPILTTLTFTVIFVRQPRSTSGASTTEPVK